MMCSRVLDDQPFVTLDAFQNGRLFYSPFTDVGPVFICFGIFLLSMRGRPSRVPVVCELFKKSGFEVGWLVSGQQRWQK